MSRYALKKPDSQFAQEATPKVSLSGEALAAGAVLVRPMGEDMPSTRKR